MIDLNTPEGIAEARRLCEAATPGPWIWKYTELTGYMDSEGDYLFAGAVFEEDDETKVGGEWNVDNATPLFTPAHNGASADDSNFIATSRTLLPAALDKIEQLRAELDNVTNGKWSAYLVELVTLRGKEMHCRLERDRAEAAEVRAEELKAERDKLAACYDLCHREHGSYAQEVIDQKDKLARCRQALEQYADPRCSANNELARATLEETK